MGIPYGSDLDSLKVISLKKPWKEDRWCSLNINFCQSFVIYSSSVWAVVFNHKKNIFFFSETCRPLFCSLSSGIVIKNVRYIELQFYTMMKVPSGTNKIIFYPFFLTECNRPLGLQDGRILNSQLSSPSHFEHLYIGNGKTVNLEAEFARLNNTLAWCSPARRNSDSTFIEIDLYRQVNISGIATQGFMGINAYYVKQYKVAYSKDRITWKLLKEVTWRFYWQHLVLINTCMYSCSEEPVQVSLLNMYCVYIVKVGPFK